jgi:hypothetical protein
MASNPFGAKSSEPRMPKATKVKNKTPAPVQITAEQIVREAKERQEDEFAAPQHRVRSQTRPRRGSPATRRLRFTPDHGRGAGRRGNRAPRGTGHCPTEVHCGRTFRPRWHGACASITRSNPERGAAWMSTGKQRSWWTVRLAWQA